MLQVRALVTSFFLLINHPLLSCCMIRTLARRSAISMTSVSLADVAKRLVHTGNKAFVCIAVAGGGGHAISALASTPGASALFLEGTIAYDRKSLHAYVGQAIPEDQKYVSYETATLLSRAAVRRALQYRDNLNDYPHCIGIGITSALRSTVDFSKSSFGYIVATLADGTVWKCSISLAANQRDRLEEDVVMGKVVLEALEQLQTRGVAKLELDNPDDVLEEYFEPAIPKDEVYAAAERILCGDVRAVLLLPTADQTFLAVTDPVLPLQSLVFPGSFNPPHVGHTTLAQVASRAHRGAPAVVFELSLTNPDKPDMDPVSVSERAHHFFTLADEIPDQWGILLTRAPLFKEKVEVLRPFMATGE
jgi:Competence-damaged protein/Cytidylyltransferase-like